MIRGAAGEIRAAKRTEARRCFGLSRAFSGRPLDRPFLLAVGGVIGSGKSTLSAALGRTLGVPVVSSDRTRKTRAGLPPLSPAGAGAYTVEARDRIYAEIVRRATEVLDSGRGAILDATFAACRWRQQAAAAARASNATFVWVEAVCPPEVLRERLAARRPGQSASDADASLLEAFVRDYEPALAEDPEPHLSIDTSQGEDAALDEALRGLSELGISPATERRTS